MSGPCVEPATSVICRPWGLCGRSMERLRRLRGFNIKAYESQKHHHQSFGCLYHWNVYCAHPFHSPGIFQQLNVKRTTSSTSSVATLIKQHQDEICNMLGPWRQTWHCNIASITAVHWWEANIIKIHYKTVYWEFQQPWFEEQNEKKNN